jgi:hypothetical protein
MPNRILKESICTSETIERLTYEQEVFFYRLLVQCDDYGEMDARPAILRSRLFPLRLEKVNDQKITLWLTALALNDLIQVYKVGDHFYLHIKTWASHQQIRAQRHKYQSIESPDVQLISPDNICNQLISIASNSPRNPIQSNPNPNPNPNPNTANAEKRAPVKQKFGQFLNVFLTTEEYEKLKTRFNSQTEEKIEELSEALKSKAGYENKYKDHYATILSWDRRNAKENFRQKKGSYDGKAISGTGHESIPGNRPAGAFSDLEKS